MKYLKVAVLATMLLAIQNVTGQDRSGATEVKSAANVTQKVVVITGARFSYPLIEKWIDEYNKTTPATQIVVEWRGSADPQRYDILAEVYEHPTAFREKREYIYVGRYAVFPVATATSSFAKTYGVEGLTRQHIVQLFFHDLFADQEKQKLIKAPYTVYTRLQKAGVPQIFSRHFGFEQKDIKGLGIAGADTHLVKALLKDSTGISYLPTAVIFGDGGDSPLEGITVIPIDANGNNKVSEEEKFTTSFKKIVAKLEATDASQIKNIPMDYLHLSIDKESASPEAIDFLKWVNENGKKYLHEFGFFLPESNKADAESFNAFIAGKGK